MVDGERDAKLKNKHNQAGERKNLPRSLSPSISPAIYSGGGEMNREEQKRQYNEKWDEAEKEVHVGKIINLSALMMNAETIHCDNLDGKIERREMKSAKL